MAAGATLVSLNPLRDTLEDFFVRRVAEMRDEAREGYGGNHRMSGAGAREGAQKDDEAHARD